MASSKSIIKEDDLAASISKSMTIDKLKNALTKNRIVYSTAKKKADFIDLYISNGLHKEKASLEELKEKKEEVLALNASAALNASPALDAVNLKEELSKSLPESVKHIPVLEELIMSITIMGHGCEELVTPWSPQSEISMYFKNNVRVYSKSCVPDVNSIGNIYQNEDVLRHVQRKFSAVPKGETAAIVSAYADEVRDEYIRDVAFSKFSKAPVSLTRGFDKLSDITNLARVSNLSTFLCNKNFSFYIDSEKERVNPIMRPVYNTLGIQLVDIRIKKTAMDGSVSYEQIFDPTDVKYIRFDLTNLNFIYKSGITYILKEILKRKDLVKPTLEIFGFGKKDRVMNISLEQIYHFFQLLGVKYANLMDYTCRACSVGRLPQNLTNSMYRTEQQYRIKPVAFGKRSDKKRSVKHSKKKQSRRLNNKKLSKHIYYKNKYSRKI
jgi:hypothetical protein